MTSRLDTPFHKVVRVTSPAAGAEFVIPAPGQGLWRVLSLHFSLTTSAVVANRVARLIADDGTSTYFHTRSPSVQAASLTFDYAAFEGSTDSAGVADNAVMPWPTSGVLLYPGYRIRSATVLLDAGDAYSDIALMVEEFPNGPRSEWVPTVDRAEYDRSM